MLLYVLRFETVGATTTLLAIATTAIVGALQHFTPFMTMPELDRMPVLQFYTIALGTTGLVLAAVVREKSDAVESRNEFIGIASHELKTPITSLKLQLQLLERKLKNKKDLTSSDQEQTVFVHKVDRQVDRLVQIVEQLLDVSHVERKTFSVEREKIDVTQLIENLVERVTPQLQSSGNTLVLNLEASVVMPLDPFRMEQVLENLISNAMKYAPGTPIEISTLLNHGFLELTVTDRGPGIEPSKQNFVFERFVRANALPHVQGLGLGLFITQKIVHAHQGTIALVSRPSQGARFQIRIPI